MMDFSDFPGLDDPKQPSFAPNAFSALKKAAETPAGVPVHHTTMDPERRFEEAEANTRPGLDMDRTWIFLGLIYAMIPGIDHSLFERYKLSGNTGLDVQTVQLDNAICDVEDAYFTSNPRAYKLSGVPKEVGQSVIDYFASYQYLARATERTPETIYRADYVEVRMADPTVDTYKRPINVWFGLPVNLTRKRTIILPEEGKPGLMMKRPVFRRGDLK